MFKTAMFLLGATLVGAAIAKNDGVANDSAKKVTIKLAHVANAVTSLATNMNLDQLVAQSIHEDDRRFSRVG